MEEDLERYESEVELKLYKEYHDVLPMFKYVVETERRFYLANQVDIDVRESNGSMFFEVQMRDAWVWDMFRPARFLQQVQVLTFRDVNVEELEKPELSIWAFCVVSSAPSVRPWRGGTWRRVVSRWSPPTWSSPEGRSISSQWTGASGWRSR